MTAHTLCHFKYNADIVHFFTSTAIDCSCTGGCTSKLQTLDVLLNKPFKSICRKEFSVHCHSQLSTLLIASRRINLLMGQFYKHMAHLMNENQTPQTMCLFHSATSSTMAGSRTTECMASWYKTPWPFSDHLPKNCQCSSWVVGLCCRKLLQQPWNCCWEICSTSTVWTAGMKDLPAIAWTQFSHQVAHIWSHFAVMRWESFWNIYYQQQSRMPHVSTQR